LKEAHRRHGIDEIGGGGMVLVNTPSIEILNIVVVVAGEVEHGGVLEWKGVGTVRGIIVTNKILHYCNNH
jgi:hypothetical protein